MAIDSAGLPPLLRGSPMRAVALVGYPLALAAIFQFSFNLIEVWIFGQVGDGGASLAGAAASDIVTGIFALLANGLGNAAVAEIAFAHGAGDELAVRRHTRQVLAIGVVLSLLSVVVGLLAGPIGEVVMAEGETRVQGTAFLRIMALGGFGTIFVAIGIAVLRARGQTGGPLGVVAVMSILTIGLEAVFVLGLWDVPKGGVVAAGVITVVLRGIGGGVLVWLIARGIPLRPPPGERFVNGAALRKQLRLGLSSAAQQSLRLVGFLVILAIVADRYATATGNPTYTAVNVWIKLDLPTIILAYAWGGGTAPIVGMALGAGRRGFAGRAAWSGVLFAVLTSLVTMTTMLIFAGALAAAFIPDDPAAVAATAAIYAYAAPAYAFLVTGIVIAMAFNGAGNMRAPLIWDAAIFIAFQSVFAFALARPGADTTDVLGLGVVIFATGALQGVIPALVLRLARWHRGASERLVG